MQESSRVIHLIMLYLIKWSYNIIKKCAANQVIQFFPTVVSSHRSLSMKNSFFSLSYGNSGIFPSMPYGIVAWRKFSLRNLDNRRPAGRLRHGIVSLFLFVTPWPPRFPSGARSVPDPSILVKIFIAARRNTSIGFNSS